MAGVETKLDELEERVERIEEELGIEDEPPQLYYELRGGRRAPHGDMHVYSALPQDDDHGFTNTGYTVYTDSPEDPDMWWRVDEHGKAHENVDKEYGYWFPEGTSFEVVVDE